MKGIKDFMEKTGTKDMLIKSWPLIIAVCFEMIVGVMGYADYFLPGNRFFLWGVFLVYIVCAVSNHLTKSEWIGFIALILIGALQYYFSGRNTMIKMVAFLFACKGKDTEWMRKLMAYSLLTECLVIYFISFFSHFRYMWIMDVRIDRGFQGKRYSFGFVNPNCFEFFMVILVWMLIFIYHEKMKAWVRILILLSMWGITWLTDSRTGLILGSMIYILFWLEYGWEKRTQRSLAKSVPLISWLMKNRSYILLVIQGIMMLSFMLISIFLACKLDNPILNQIDNFISGRGQQLGTSRYGDELHLGYAENWTLFSNPLNGNYYDLGYVQIFYRFGIIPGMIYLGYIMYVIFILWTSKNVKGQIMMLGLTSYLFMESLYFGNSTTQDFLIVNATFLFYESKRSLKNMNGG